MPKIFASTISEHHDQVWMSLVDAVETCLASRPYDDITIADIARVAGIARNTIYNYARDKSDLVGAVVDFSARPLVHEVARVAESDGPVSERVEKVAAAILDWVSSGTHRAIVGHAMFGTPFDPLTKPAPIVEIAEHIQRVARDGERSGIFRLDSELTLDLLSGVMQAASAIVFRDPAQRSSVEPEAVRIVLSALAP